VSEAEVSKAILSFPAGSAGGPDGVRPQHLIELIRCPVAGAQLLTALTAFVNRLLKGQCPLSVRPVLFGASLIALEKKCGGIRPIAVGYTLRRVAAKCANYHATRKLAPMLQPLQVGVGIPGGCEAAVHAVRRFIQSMPAGSVVAKLDFSNAFNAIHRSSVLNAVAEQVPEIFRFCHLSYGGSSKLKYGNYIVHSCEGVQQGDPLGPLLFLHRHSSVTGVTKF
jgi:hypothetical protein